MKDIKEIELSGAMQLNAAMIKGDELEIEAEGSSRVQAHVDVQELDIEGKGGTNFNISGRTVKQKVKLLGASKYNAGSLTSQEAEVKGEGSTRLMLTVAESISGELVGASILSYRGNPKITVKTTGAASVNNVG